jgi:WD40 repeat protein
MAASPIAGGRRMTPLRQRLLVLLALPALLGKPSASAADALPSGARLRIGTGRFHHGGAVSRILPLPDGQRLLTLAHDGKARVWDIAAEKELFQIALNNPSVGLVFSVAPDGKTLATANFLDHTIHVWSLTDGKEVQVFAPLPANQRFADLEYSPDGKCLVSAHLDHVFRIWDLATARVVRQLGQPRNPLPNLPAATRATYLPDGKALAVIEDWGVRVLDAEDGKELRWFSGHTSPVAALAFSPDGKRMATVAADRAVRVWELATGQTVARLPVSVGGGRELAFDRDGRRLAVLCSDRTIHVFDAQTQKPLSHIDLGPGGPASTFALTPDGKSIFVSSGETVLRGYVTATGKELYSTTGHVGPVQALAWAPNGKHLATSGQHDRTVFIWDTVRGDLLHRLPALDPGFTTTQVQFAADGKALLTYGTDRKVHVWDAADGRELNSFAVAPLVPTSFAFSCDGRLAAAATLDRKVRVWELSAARQQHILEIPQATGRNNAYAAVLTFSGDNRTLTAHLPYERLVRRWDAVTGRELGEWKGDAAALGIYYQARSADGRNYLVLQGAATQMIEAATGRPRQTFTLPGAPAVPGPRARPTAGNIAAALSPDARILGTLGNDGVLRFWNTGSGKILAERPGLPAGSGVLAFAPDSKTLASAGAASGALLWDVPGAAGEGQLVPEGASPDELWKDLSGEDSARAWQAILALSATPRETITFVQRQLQPSAAPDAARLAKFIADLDADEFQKRETATEDLVRAGKAAEDVVRKALASRPSAEAKQRLEFVLGKLKGDLGPNLQEVRAARAIEVLEKIGTAEARQLLDNVAHGADGPLTAEARAALERLQARVATP